MAGLVEEVRITDMATNTVAGAQPDLSLLEPLYQLYVGCVYTLSLRLLTEARVAEEATGQVFVRLSRELSRRWGEGRALTRLRELAIEEALARLNVRGDEVAVPVVAQTPLPVRASPPALLNAVALDELTAQLPDGLRAVFVLHDCEGLSAHTVAAHLRLGEADVRRLLHEARMEMRRLWLSTSAGEGR